MYLKSVLTAAALTIALPAMAQEIPEGEVQFAKSINVEPGVYSMPTMILIEQAMRNEEEEQLELLLQRTKEAELEGGLETVSETEQIATEPALGN